MAAAVAPRHPGVFLADYLVDGIHAQEWTTLLLVAAVLGALNVFLKPLLIFFALPFVIFTFGFGIIVINAVLVLLAGNVVPGFEVVSFWSAFWGGLIISLASMLASMLFGDRENPKFKATFRVNRRSAAKRKDIDVIDV